MKDQIFSHPLWILPISAITGLLFSIAVSLVSIKNSVFRFTNAFSNEYVETEPPSYHVKYYTRTDSGIVAYELPSEDAEGLVQNLLELEKDSSVVSFQIIEEHE